MVANPPCVSFFNDMNCSFPSVTLWPASLGTGSTSLSILFIGKPRLLSMKLTHWGRKGLGGSSVMESSGTEDCWLLLLEETVNLVNVLVV